MIIQTYLFCVNAHNSLAVCYYIIAPGWLHGQVTSITCYRIRLCDTLVDARLSKAYLYQCKV